MAPQRPNYVQAARQLRPGNTPTPRRNVNVTSILEAAGGGKSGDGDGGGGLAGNLRGLRDLVTGLPGGVVGLAKGVAEVPLGFARLGIDVAQGDDFSDDFGTNLGEYFPILEDFRQSGVSTATRLRHPGRYIDAWNEGQLAAAVVEDVGNLALLGGAASKAATAAGAPATGARLATAARLGDQFGASPAKVYTAGPAALNRTVGRLTGRTLTERAAPAVRRVIVAGPDASPLRRGIARALDPQVREARRDLADSGTRIAEAQAVPLEEMALRLRDADPDLLAAANVARTGFYDTIGRRIRDLGDDEFGAVIESTFGEGLTPTAARLAIDAAEGRLSPAQQAIFDQAQAAADAVAAGRDDLTFARPDETPEQFIARTGRTEGPLNPEQLGDAPMQRVLDADRRIVRDRGVIRRIDERDLPAAVERAERLRDAATTRLDETPDRPASGQRLVGRAEQRAMTAEAQVRKLERRVENLNARIAKRVDELSAPTGAATPKRWRQIAAESDRAVAALRNLAEEANDPALMAKLNQIADEIPRTLDEFKAEGINPAHLIGGYVPERGRLSLRQQNAQLPRVGRTTTSRQARSMAVDYRMSQQAVQEAAEARRLMANVAANEFMAKYGDTAANLVPEAEGLTGRALAQVMRQEGYVPYNPRSIFSVLDDAEVKPTTQFLPRNLYETMAYTLSTRTTGIPTQLLLRGNQAWKNALLPLSPTWYLGNTLGNALMAMVGSGMDPVTYTRLMVDGIRQMRADGMGIRDVLRGETPSTSPRRLRTAGLTYAESGALDPNRALRQQSRSRLRRGYQRFAEGAYGVNEFLDNLNKNAVYLHELARAEGNPALMSRLATDGLDPNQYAIREALRVMGDFSRLAPWEQRAIAVMPFYRWARHITQLTLRLPVEHPMRAAWTLRIPDMFGEDQSDWPAWLQGSVTVGNWVLPARYLNPFGDVAGSEGGPLGVGGALLDPDTFARSLSPFIKFGTAAVTGLDLSSGLGADVTMPTDQRRIDPNSGRPTTTPLFDPSNQGINLSGLANYAANQLPVARNLRDLVFGDHPRYDTGERITSLRPREQFFQGPSRLTQLVGIPEPIAMDDVEQQRRRLRSALGRRG